LPPVQIVDQVIDRFRFELGELEFVCIIPEQMSPLIEQLPCGGDILGIHFHLLKLVQQLVGGFEENLLISDLDLELGTCDMGLPSAVVTEDEIATIRFL
tara:strand:- start:125 stop:421 length:297 start_codon:yes stop_codon:yes gene_type:complete